eukprot:2264724-Rhodomonas_salina.1
MLRPQEARAEFLRDLLEAAVKVACSPDSPLPLLQEVLDPPLPETVEGVQGRGLRNEGSRFRVHRFASPDSPLPLLQEQSDFRLQTSDFRLPGVASTLSTLPALSPSSAIAASFQLHASRLTLWLTGKKKKKTVTKKIFSDMVKKNLSDAVKKRLLRGTTTGGVIQVVWTLQRLLVAGVVRPEHLPTIEALEGFKSFCRPLSLLVLSFSLPL